jgi:uncharacterized protein with beta-barrel porin domain
MKKTSGRPSEQNTIFLSDNDFGASVSWKQTIIPKQAPGKPLSVPGISLPLLWKGVGRWVWILSVAVVFAVAGGRDAAAVNTGCVDGDCPDVPADGISYTSGIDTVTAGDGTAGTTTVDNGVIGVELTRVGAVGADATVEATFLVIEDYDIDPAADTEDLRDVVSADGITPRMIDGRYIISDGADEPTYTIGTDSYTGLELAQFLTAQADDAGGTITGSLTVNNTGSFSTTDADGIYATSEGGKGGNGGCSTVVVYTWCDDGDCGGDAGSVVVNSNAAITVNGTGEGKTGVTAISRGGDGGNGGGSFGLFASSAGAGGDGGDGGSVFVNLGADSNITTHGSKGHGVFAQSRGGDGGSGGAPSSLVALGTDGGNGGHGGNVVVGNGGSILTTGLSANGIYALSVGAGAGAGSDAGGLVAIGGNGGGLSNGADVSVNNSGSVETRNTDAVGIFAQSIGGGGGSGGFAGGLVSIGGSGDSGGAGGDVSVDNSGIVSTSGFLARGIVAQSIGGGGGDGAGAFGLAYSDVNAGGTSGDGGAVNVANSGTVSTGGAVSTAIFAQSIGGGGGSVDGAGSLFVSLGGDAGSAGNGNTVTVSNTGTVTTNAALSRGIFAQSIGKGGGSGAGSWASIYATGGNGSGGGDGGAVHITNDGAIETTSGFASDAIFAQSVGGGGGDGGGSGSFALAYTSGGDGGSSGSGGDIDIENNGDILASGLASRGIFTQSVGGGGGNGTVSTAGFVSLGGDGGSSGNGGDLNLTNTGTIATSGHNSEGILAQSIGGGGGSASTETAGALFSTAGGSGGSAGHGGAIDIVSSDLITTSGINSSGIFAQSIGGGGGNGGNASTIGFSIPFLFTFGISAGGDGGSGGSGSTVAIANDGDIITNGLNSQGILAQSIGGGGGNGANGQVWTAGIFTQANVNLGFGGDAGATGSGGSLDVDNAGRIFTLDDVSNGILAQSIGGGGGNGGNAQIVRGAFNCDNSIEMVVGGDGGAGGNGGRIDVDSGGAIVTEGYLSSGILAQSIGGGGGNGGDAKVYSLEIGLEIDPADPSASPSVSATFTLGGSGGASGSGGSVNINNSETIITGGDFSSGILAQSIGGGGGTGGNAATYQIELNDPLSAVSDLFYEINYTFKLGGNGGHGGSGGSVTVQNSGDIITTGASSTGIIAQSIGGGGGTGGDVITFEYSGLEPVEEIVDHYFDTGGFSMVLQGSGGAAGNGGNVTVANDGSITTDGAFAHGIFAQSVGGGGGLAGMCETLDISELILGSDANGRSSQVSGAGVSFAGSLGGNGSSGAITINQTGNIMTHGDAAHGIFAQSAAGGFSSSGTISITMDGDISARGIDSDAIYAQSTSALYNGNVSVNILGGSIQGGSGSGAGVHIDSRADNTVTNAGTISSLSGMALLGGHGNETINNYGTITGNVDLGPGNNAFNNYDNAVFDMGADIHLASGRLTNSGIFSPGGAGTVHTTALTGNATQTSSGIYAVDLDLGAEHADRLNVSGASVLSGTVSLNILNRESVKPGTDQMTILSSAGGVTDSGLTLQAEPSAVMDYTLLYPNSTDVVLSTSIDFSPRRGLNRNQQAIGEAVNAILSAGGSTSFAPIAVELLSLPDAKAIKDAYDNMSPESYGPTTTTTRKGTRQYTQTLVKRMHSMRAYLDTTGAASGTRQTLPYGLWIDWFGESGDQETDDGFTGFGYSLGGVGIGLDRLMNDRLLAGISYGRSHIDIDLDGDRGWGDVKSNLFSLYGSLFSDKYYIDLALSYGRESYDNLRRIDVGALSESAVSSHHGDLYSFYTQAGYNVEMHQWIAQPFAALHYIYLDEESYRESGAGGLDLLVDGRTTDSLVSDLGLRFNKAFKKGNLAYIPEVSIAWRHDFDIDDGLVHAAFEGVPDVSFTTESREIDEDGILIGGGVTLINQSRLSLYLRYDGELRGDFSAQRLSGGWRYEF